MNQQACQRSRRHPGHTARCGQRAGLYPGQTLDHLTRQTGNVGIGKSIPQGHTLARSQIAQFRLLPFEIGRVERIFRNLFGKVRVGQAIL